MIQLYKRGNANYDFNGDYNLLPESCYVEMQLNGTWNMTLQHSIDERGVFREIVNEAVIMAPTPVGERQLFRIYDCTKNESGVTAYARPIFFDAAQDTFLSDVRPTNKTGQQALEIMVAGTKYKVESDISNSCTAYYVQKNLIEAISSDDENSFLNRWGGEIIYNNYKIIINERAGGDYGVSATFGKNLNGIEENINFDEVTTKIVPVAYNGYMLEGPEPWVESPLANKYVVQRIRVIKYDDVKLTEDAYEDEVSFATLEELREELVRRCNLEFENGIDKPKANYMVNMSELANTIEYKSYEIFEKVGLGDTIYASHAKLGIETVARCISITYDCIREKNDTVELGDFQENYITTMSSNIESTFNMLDSVVDADGNLKGENIVGTIDLMKTKLKASREVAKKQSERAILFEDLDKDSPTYGAMAIGTTGFQIASERTIDGRDWKWTTFGTGEGFLADCIIAGVMYSKNYIEGKQGVKFDLNTGLFEAAKLIINAKNLQITEDGEVTANKFKSSSAEITGGTFIVEDGEDGVSYLKFKCKMTDGTTCQIDVSPSKIITQNLNTREYAEISPYGSLFRNKDGSETRINGGFAEMKQLWVEELKITGDVYTGKIELENKTIDVSRGVIISVS